MNVLYSRSRVLRALQYADKHSNQGPSVAANKQQLHLVNPSQKMQASMCAEASMLILCRRLLAMVLSL